MKIFDFDKAYSQCITPKTEELLKKIHTYRSDFKLSDKPNILTTQAFRESIESSNRIEGLFTREERLRQIANYEIEPESLSEKEIAGYRDVLTLVNENFEYMPLKPSIILQMHRDLYKYEDISIGGKFKNGDNQIIETDKNGIRKLRFSPLSAWEMPRAMDILCENCTKALNHEEYDPLILIAIFVLDYVCIHPFNDGNGRTSRLLTSLLLYRSGFFVGKYISLEKLIEENKVGYYEVLQLSSEKWREDQHNYLPFVEYFLQIIFTAYRKYFSLLEEKKSSVATDDISN